MVATLHWHLDKVYDSQKRRLEMDNIKDVHACFCLGLIFLLCVCSFTLIAIVQSATFIDMIEALRCLKVLEHVLSTNELRYRQLALLFHNE